MAFRINPNLTLQNMTAEKREAEREPYLMRNFEPLYMAGNLLVGGFQAESADSRQKQLHRALCDEAVQDALSLDPIAHLEPMSRLSDTEVLKVGGAIQAVSAENGLVFAQLSDN